MDSKKFELVAQEEIKNSFPTAFVRAGVQIRSLRQSAEVDLFILLPKGVFLIECKNYSGKISGSFNYDQKQGELWTCQTPTGEVVQITSSGKNPADQALARFHALHDLAKEAWGEANRPYIYPVLLFPEAADLSGITQMTVYPGRPSTADRVVATTLVRLIGYLGNADSTVEQVGALKLIDFLGIPRASLSGTWLLEPPSQTQTNGDNRQSNEQKRSKDDQNLNAGGGYPEAYGSTREKSDTIVAQFEDSLARGAKPYETAVEYSRTVPSKPLSRQIRWSLVVLTLAVVAVVAFMIGRMTPKPPIETASPYISPQPLSPQEPKVEPLSPVQPETWPPPSTSGFVPDPQPTPGGTKSLTPEPQNPPPEPKREAIVRETPIPRRPAEAGTYQTVKVTHARREPNESSDVVDELGPGRKLNVIGSQGDWLVVKSTTRQMTVYIKRDDAMLISGRESYQDAQLRWKKVEAEITESLAKWGVTGVSASFSNDTVYLEGQVQTDYERFRAEMAAKSIPDVQHIINRIRLLP